MTVLTLVRHGETQWNRDALIQGSTDIPLNDTGREQARVAGAALRETLDDTHPIVVVSSDLSRARETAEIIAAALDVPGPRTYAGLRERNYGEAEGLGVAEFAERWGTWHEAQVPGAETRAQLRDRALDGLRLAVRDVRRDTAPRPANLLVVSHGALIREVLHHASGGTLPLPGERIANASAHTLLMERERLSVLSYAGVAA